MLTRAPLAGVAGTCAGGGLSVTLEACPDGLFADNGGPRSERLVAFSATRFGSDKLGIIVQFAPDYR